MGSTNSYFSLLAMQGDIEANKRLDEMNRHFEIAFERLGKRDPLPEGEDVALVAHSMQFDTPVHTHSFYELIYVDKGEVINVVEGKSLYMRAGDLCVMGYESSHSLHAVDRDATVINVCLRRRLFQTDYFREFYAGGSPTAMLLRGEAQNNYLFYPDASRSIVETLVHVAAADYVAAGFRQTLALCARVLQLLCETTRLKVHTYYGIDERTLEILQRIAAHPETATVSSVAREFGYSPNYFSQYIRKHTGYAPKEIITRYRLDRAAALLTQTDMTVERVAEAVGYANCGNFHVIFKRQFGRTPDRFRHEPQVE